MTHSPASKPASMSDTIRRAARMARRAIFAPTACTLFLVAALCVTGLPVGCASTAVDGPVSADELGKDSFLGAWTSDLDGAALALEETGIFSIDVPARATAPARSVVGRWKYNAERKAVTFTNLAGSAACADVPGEYAVEVVRDTVRFTKVKDSCPSREEHMAWGWKKAATPG